MNAKNVSDGGRERRENDKWQWQISSVQLNILLSQKASRHSMEYLFVSKI
jgi:hypothetical protein